MLKRLPDLVYNVGSSSLDPKFIVGKNIWKRAEIQDRYKNSHTFDDTLLKWKRRYSNSFV